MEKQAGTRRRWRLLRHRHPATKTPTFVFADLAGYTALTEIRGDAHAAEVAREFRRLMCRLSCSHGARQLKSMGDGVMILAPDSAAAVCLATDAVDAVATQAGLLPVSVGVHTGPAVRRGGDWYGRTVNIAARLADQAGPNQVLVSDVAWVLAACEIRQPVAARRDLPLKGIAAPVGTWRLV